MRRQLGFPRVRLVFFLGICGISPLLCAAPSLAVIYAYDSPLTFRWDPSSGDVDHYNVYLSVDGEPFELVELPTENTCQVDAQEGRTYVLQVEAENAIGLVGPLSDPSEEVFVSLNGSPDDMDGDGMTNTWEAIHGLNPFDPGDADDDPDGDGLVNLDEFHAQTDPTDPDSDDDGVVDGQDQDPRDPTDNRPVADAGEDQELDPTVVTLDGSGSYDPNGDLLTYSWTQTNGADVELSDAHVMSPAFLGKISGQYVFELIVNDGRVNSLSDEVSVLIRNVAPSADAGSDQEVEVGTRVFLDASDSRDPNEDVLSYSWTQTAGPLIALEGAHDRVASFVPGLPGVYLFELVAFDGELYSPADEVQVIVNSVLNHVPRADAGDDQTVTVGTRVTLDGSGSSDLDGDPLTYEWSQVEGPASVTLEGVSSAQAQFEPQQAGLYRFELVVNDGSLSSPPDDVRVTVESAENRIPVAVIEDVEPAYEGAWVTLDGSGSFDPDDDPLTYLWTQTGGPKVTLEDTDQPVAGFYAVTEGTLDFQLVVDDGEQASWPASVEVRILPEDPDAVVPPTKKLLLLLYLLFSVWPEDPDPVVPPTDNKEHVQSSDSGGCSVGLRGSLEHKVDASDFGFVLTLFLPPIATALYQKRKVRRRKRKTG